ncbi:hypothetical protein [Endozoicomonas lisbonensis]|uniref:Uncharacterized protein n=1 Tax=Endozoicomonas lisbonensis TaxID=3120522 RepID=A0ABV2SCU6_9GAMM
MSVFSTLMKYKDDGLIRWFDPVGDCKANIKLPNGDNYVVLVNSQYIMGDSVIDEALSGSEQADYIIYNKWDTVTGSAQEYADNTGIEIVSFGRFFHLLRELNEE